MSDPLPGQGSPEPMERLVRAGLGAVVARLEELTERIERLEAAVIRLVGSAGPPLRPVPPPPAAPSQGPAPLHREPSSARPAAQPSVAPAPAEAALPRIDETLIWGARPTGPKEARSTPEAFAASVEEEEHRRSGLFRRRKEGEPPAR